VIAGAQGVLTWIPPFCLVVRRMCERGERGGLAATGVVSRCYRSRQPLGRVRQPLAPVQPAAVAAHLPRYLHGPC
jgi:hypothetical protein